MIKAFFVLLALAACVIGAGMAYTRTLPVNLPAEIPSYQHVGDADGQDGTPERCRHRRC